MGKKIIGKLVNRRNHPLEISYAGQALMLAPKGSTENDIEKAKLGSLPPNNAVVFIEYQGK